MFGDCKTCKHSEWVDGEGAACGKLKTALVISSDLSKVFTINFAKSNYKVGMELEGLLKKASSFPYTRVYGLASTTSSTAKNVEIFKIEVLEDKLRKTPEEYLPFLKDLFGIVSTDRKAMLDVFYENSKKRQAQLSLSGNAPLALETSSEAASGESVVTVEPSKESVSSMAKGYVV